MGSGAGYGSMCHEIHCKAISKAVNAAALLSQLVNGKMPASGHGKQTIVFLDKELPSMNVGETVVIADETFSDSQEISTHRRNMFLAMHFHFANASVNCEHNFTTTQYLQISCPNLKSEASFFTEQNVPVYDHVEISSGICIFNGDIIQASISEAENGAAHFRKIMYSKPTIYEMEYIARSSSAIADIASVLIARTRGHRSRPLISIGLDVPSFQYYYSVVDKFDKGLCPARKALEWIDAVDLRHDQIAQVFTNSVEHELRRRGANPDDYRIHASSRSTTVALSIKQALQNGSIPSLGSILQRLDHEKDGLWRAFYQFVPTKEKPRIMEDLGYLFYVFEAIKAALENPATAYPVTSRLEGTRHSRCTLEERYGPMPENETRPKPRRLIIAIDDAAERRIYSRSQEILKKIRQSHIGMSNSTLVEVYLGRRVFINGNKTRVRLYSHDPMPEVPTLSQIQECDCDGGQLVKASEVVRLLYGSDCAQKMMLLFAQAGLQE